MSSWSIRGGLAAGATGKSGPMVRQHYLHPTLVRMAMEASENFHNFGDAIGDDARFQQTGRLLMFPMSHRRAAEANFANAICRGGYGALYAMTPDGNPIRHSSAVVDGLYWAVGFSGHGFKLSPVVGRMVAELIARGDSADHPIREFRASRYAEGQPLEARHPYQGRRHQ